MVGFKLWVSALSIVAAGSVARVAQGEAAHLVWNAPRECPPETALRAEVTRLLGEVSVEGGGFDATADVTADAGRFTLVLLVRTAGGAGTRTLSAETCDSLLNVAAFSIALAVNPELGSSAPAEPSEDAAPPAPPAPAQPRGPQPVAERSPETPASPRTNRPSSPPELWLGARVIGDTSLLPSPALGAGVTADALLLGVLRLGLGGQAFIPQKELLSGGTGGIFTLWAVEGRACYELALRVRLSLCPLIQWGALNGSGRGVEEQLEQRSTVIAPGGVVLGRVPFAPRWSLVLGVTGLAPLSHDRFVVNAGQVHEIPSFSAQGSLGIEARAF